MVCRTKKKMLVLYLWCRNEVRSKCGVSMNLQQARRTLGITPEDDKAAIKKKYRHLMGQFHPDAQVGENALDSIRRAQEINEAYEYLKKHTGIFQSGATTGKGSRRTASGTGTQSAWKDRPPKNPEWTGRINEKAFCKRNVYQRYSMEVEGPADKLYYRVARGRYLWDPATEDFTLFVTSLHHVTKELLEQTEERAARKKAESVATVTTGAWNTEADRFQIQSRLFYHLSAQFTDPVQILDQIAKPKRTDEAGRKIYHFHTSLGADATQPAYRRLTALQPEDAIYPLAFQENRILVCREKQYPLGHLFFEDDRLYFCVIPLLQEKLAQVQMKVRKVQVLRKNHPYKVKVDIDLYFRAEKEIMTYKGRDRNFEIAKILNDYEADLTGKMRKSWK
jgi:hypothetical protein